jgi:phosphatidate cytidylyltransferase
MVGRNKLIEWLSPKKTWEGFAGGLATAIATAVIAGGWLHSAGVIALPDGWLGFPWGLVLFGLVMGIVSTAGDLCASLLKRDAAVKDSSQMIPGMGGVLDIFDSPLLTAPVAWFFWTRVMQAGG